MMNRILTAVLIATFVGLPARLRADEVDDAVAAHVAAWKKVRSFAFTYDSSFELVDFGKVRQTSELTGQTWASDAGRERYHFVDLYGSNTVRDVLATEAGTLEVRYSRRERPWDRDRSFEDQGRVHVERQTGPPDAHRIELPCLLRYFQFHEDTEWQTPEGIAAKWQRAQGETAAPADAPIPKTTRSWRFRRGEPGPWRDNDVELTFDSAVGGLCRTMRDEFTAPASDGSGPVKVVREFAVREFRKFDGVWFPVRIESVMSVGPDSRITNRWTLSDVRVNTLTDSDTSLPIPENVAVVSHRPDGSQGEVVLYGKREQPVRTFATVKEYTQFQGAENRKAEMQEKTRKSPRRTASESVSPAR